MDYQQNVELFIVLVLKRSILLFIS